MIKKNWTNLAIKNLLTPFNFITIFLLQGKQADDRTLKH